MARHWRWLAGLAVTAAVATGILWYAPSRGWLEQATAWARGRTVEETTDGSMGGMSMSGMNMSGMKMPGMDMGSANAKESTEPSGVPGLAVVQLAPELQQRIGVVTAAVDQAPLRMSVRTVGIIQPDETRVARVHLRTEGWVRKVIVNYTGKAVKKGDPLLSLYSPQFVTTQQEYLDAARNGQDALAQLARQRLELWDVPADEIDAMKREGKPLTYLTLRSPAAGTVLQKNVFEDQYVTNQTELYVVADLSTVWVQAKVYEYELPHVALGQPAAVTLPALPDETLSGKVVFIQPTVEEPARTVQVRVELPNHDGRLKPGMFANINIEHHMGEGILVPATAVIRTGERDYAFRADDGNRFAANEVQISPFRFGDRYHILKGLKRGDRVVTSATFLIDSESRLRFGSGGSMPGMPGMEMGAHGMEGMKKHGKSTPP
jgi:Cu(I)/Ag(I) efflux system membrane fusion protein